MKKVLKITLLLFLSLFISNLNLFAQIVFVEDITGVPDTAIVGKPLSLTGTVMPENATHKNITWSISDAGTTEATIIENTLHTNSAGTAILTAKIDETLVGKTFTKNFIIEVTELVGINDLVLANIKIYPNPTTGELRIENYELRIDGVVLDISHLLAGVYFVKIQTETGEVVRKVVKQ